MRLYSILKVSYQPFSLGNSFLSNTSFFLYSHAFSDILAGLKPSTSALYVHHSELYLYHV